MNGCSACFLTHDEHRLSELRLSMSVHIEQKSYEVAPCDGSPSDSAGARYTTLARTMHIHPPVSESVPTMLQEMQPLP
jgi:hypothetical protein